MLFFVYNSVSASVRETFNNGLKETSNGTGHKYIASEDVDSYGKIGTIISIFLTFTGIIFMGLLIFGGFKWMKSSGREQDISDA